MCVQGNSKVKVRGGPNSSLTTILSIWNCVMGSSLLTMPWAFEKAGFTQTVVIMIVCGIICYYTGIRVDLTFTFRPPSVKYFTLLQKPAFVSSSPPKWAIKQKSPVSCQSFSPSVDTTWARGASMPHYWPPTLSSLAR